MPIEKHTIVGETDNNQWVVGSAWKNAEADEWFQSSVTTTVPKHCIKGDDVAIGDEVKATEGQRSPPLHFEKVPPA